MNSRVVVWLEGEIRTPPFSREARLEAGLLLRKLQARESLSMPQSRPMPTVGARCHELRVQDERSTWRVIYRRDADAVVILDVFSKKTQRTPKTVIQACKARLRRYDEATAE